MSKEKTEFVPKLKQRFIRGMLGHPLCIILPQVFTVKPGARMGDYWAQSQKSPRLPSRAQALSVYITVKRG